MSSHTPYPYTQRPLAGQSNDSIDSHPAYADKVPSQDSQPQDKYPYADDDPTYPTQRATQPIDDSQDISLVRNAAAVGRTGDYHVELDRH